jgi:site-specific DNA-methyltransferase (adenine-specific)
MARRAKQENRSRSVLRSVPIAGARAMRAAAREAERAGIRLLGDSAPASNLPSASTLAYQATDPRTALWVGDCRDALARLPERGSVDLVFADPPFNRDMPYDGWRDGMPRADYERFTFDWMDGCIGTLSRRGSLWVNAPDEIAAEIVLHGRRRGLHLMNWCIWHFRFGPHRRTGFIESKTHALWFARDPIRRIWNPDPVLEPSDRATLYGDRRSKEPRSGGERRAPLDVWYGPYWGRVHGKSVQRRPAHPNQLPEAYLERVILACSDADSLVLDPFCGSGTTSTVARAYGRASVSIEISPSTARSAWNRIVTVGMVSKGKALARSNSIRNSKML